MGRVVGVVGGPGPLIDVKVMPPAVQVEAFKAAGLPYGRPRILKGLIDTGANCSAIDREIAEDLKLTSHGFTLIHTPSTGAAYVERLQYAACLIVGEGRTDALVLTPPAVESDFSTRAFQVLAGRDVLESRAFAHDGPTGRFGPSRGADRRPPPVDGRRPPPPDGSGGGSRPAPQDGGLRPPRGAVAVAGRREPTPARVGGPRRGGQRPNHEADLPNDPRTGGRGTPRAGRGRDDDRRAGGTSGSPRSRGRRLGRLVSHRGNVPPLGKLDSPRIPGRIPTGLVRWRGRRIGERGRNRHRRFHGAAGLAGQRRFRGGLTTSYSVHAGS